MTPDTLKPHTRKELAALARDHRVLGWHAMRKEQLIEALVDAGRGLRCESRRPVRPPAGSRRPPRQLVATTTPQQHLPPPVRPSVTPRRDMLIANAPDGAGHQLQVTAMDPYWLSVTWTVTPAALRRAETALGPDWHRAVAVLRVYDVTTEDGGMPVRAHVEDIKIHGEVDHWFVPVRNPPRTYRLELGYATPAGGFYSMMGSNSVKTSQPGGKGNDGKPWTQPASRRSSRSTDAEAYNSIDGLLQLLGERAALGSGSRSNVPTADFPFHLDAELVLHGRTQPGAVVTCLDARVAVGDDGAFVLHLPLQDGRQVIPTVAVVPDGSEQRTIVLAIERNTRVLEPQSLEEAY